jgi:hypothetical protein
MPQYFFAPKLIGTSDVKTEIQFGLWDELEHEKWVQQYPIEDVELLIAAVLSETYEDPIRRTIDPLILVADGSQIRPVSSLVVNKILKIDQLRQGIEGHFFTQCYLGALDVHLISQHLSNLETLTEHYGDLLSAFEDDMSNTIGKLFQKYVDLTPDDDIKRTYQFLGGKRKLIVPKYGNYNRIELPEELICTNSVCRVGRMYGSIRELNDLAARIDWECIQIAHTMKDHQETTNPNGPYWVI